MADIYEEIEQQRNDVEARWTKNRELESRLANRMKSLE
jgi:hypothetical protein